ncbi:MAG TPA: ChbG/HpnK family deacetylase [Thermoanaerobaculia bacterium]|nr:ChbG/HpnK family deacetylase [Thermoanaerobaculia bacterium]
MKRLVVTADDAGLHPGMTAGVLAAHDAGIVTATSVSANGRAFDDAVARLRERPGLDVGVHLTLVGERPLSPPEEVPSLLGGDGRLLPAWPVFARRWLLGRIRPDETEAELRRQIERLLATGLPVVHLNAHQHLHVLPGLFERVLRLAVEHRIPWVRIPTEPVAALSPRALQITLLNALGRRARRRLGPSGPRSAGRTIGVLTAGHLTIEALGRSLDQAGEITELVCHPGVGEAELAGAYDWGYAWDAETAALCDPRVPDLLSKRKIELTSFSRLTKNAAASV